MSQKYTRVPTDTFEKLQLNAGILVDEFDPTNGTIGNILGATTGGINFTTNPSFTDFGEDIDNVPNNMLELKHIEQWAPKMSGTFLTVSADVAKALVGAADVDGIKVTPRADVSAEDYADLWWIGDYSDVNTGDNAGFLAVHLINGLNTSGFQIQSSKNEKGKLSFEFEGHYSIEAQDTVPFEIYVKGGTDVITPKINLNKHYTTITAEGTETLTATVYPADAEIIWSSESDAVATVVGGVVNAVAEGNTIITAEITVDGVTVNDTCTVVVTAAGA